ncbi:DUF4174 domain-containing protein [uncultured Aquimonas sp.]|uniref:DUF4174 domain-containing protein n=1 Tax=uncultured Aquimonas sp. TaxID=385483 RepID=UPI00086DC21E|nr:DUF4174 domain-containing protein [uncultured Aquimonas sp.]ODU45527.1 MAG: hypothetical protein ABS96_14010 [Xanthomonadaceae bacterium SCN 69-123]
MLSQAQDWLQTQRWAQRLVIVDAPLEAALTPAMASYDAALRERRMAVWVLDDGGLRWIGGSAPSASADVDEAQLASLRQALEGAPMRPGLHLFGLDGGLKASRSRAEQLQELIDAVDSMPMRVREARGDTVQPQ